MSESIYEFTKEDAELVELAEKFGPAFDDKTIKAQLRKRIAKLAAENKELRQECQLYAANERSDKEQVERLREENRELRNRAETAETIVYRCVDPETIREVCQHDGEDVLKAADALEIVLYANY